MTKDKTMQNYHDGSLINEGTKKLENEPVALMIYRGELCYKSQEDDQSFGMWCPVTQDLPFPEGTKFYTIPPQRKPLTNEQITKAFNEAMAERPKDASNAETNRLFVRAIEAAHGIN